MNVLLDENISIWFWYAVPKLEELGYDTVVKLLGKSAKDEDIATYANLNGLVIETNDKRLALEEIKNGHVVHYTNRNGVRLRITPIVEELEPMATYSDDITRTLLASDQVIRA